MTLDAGSLVEKVVASQDKTKQNKRENVWILAPDILVQTPPPCVAMVFQGSSELCYWFIKCGNLVDKNCINSGGERLSHGSRREKWTPLSKQRREHDLWPLSSFCLWTSTGYCMVGTVARGKKALLKSLPGECAPLTLERPNQRNPGRRQSG